MIGTPTALSVRVSRKLNDGDYGSFEVAAELTLSLPADANLEEAFDASDAWLTAAVAGSVREKQANIAKQKPVTLRQQADIDAANDVTGHVAQAVQPAPVAEIRTPVTDEGAEYRTIDVEFFEVAVDANNIRVC